MGDLLFGHTGQRRLIEGELPFHLPGEVAAEFALSALVVFDELCSRSEPPVPDFLGRDRMTALLHQLDRIGDLNARCASLAIDPLIHPDAYCTSEFVKPSRIHEQLKAALTVSGWSVPELLEKSGLDVHYTSLARKLNGKGVMSTDEAEQLAETFRKHGFAITLTFPKNGRAA